MRDAATLMRMAAAVALLLACARERQERPPPPEACEADCRTLPRSGISGGIAGVTSDGGAEADAAAPEPGRVQGEVVLLTDFEFMQGTVLDAVTVEVSAPSSGAGRSVADYDGSQAFELDDVRVAEQVWFGVEQTRGSLELMNSLQPIDTRSPGLVFLATIARSTMEAVASEGALTAPVSLDPARGHVVLHFVDATSAPVSGVSVTNPGGTTVAYDAGATYSDALTETDTRGSALILNIPAPSFPGSEEVVNVSSDFGPVSIPLQVAADTVTLATYEF